VFVRSRGAFIGDNYNSYLGVDSLANNNTPTKVLIITNDLGSGESLEMLLEQHKFQIRSTSTCGEGENLANQFKPDVILVDLWDPKSGGDKFCAEIRAYSAAPILVLSTHNKHGFVEKILDAGADECLIKPAPTNILVAHLNTLSRRYKVERNAQLAIGQMCINTVNNSVWHN
jgi:two-component system response regulator ParR